jgi:hypothetical protein
VRLGGRIVGVVAVVVGVTALTWLAMRHSDRRGSPATTGPSPCSSATSFAARSCTSTRVAGGRRPATPWPTSSAAGWPRTSACSSARPCSGSSRGPPRAHTARGDAARRFAVALEGAAAFFIFAPLYVVGLSLLMLFGSGIALVEVGVHIPRAYVPFDQSPLRWAGALVVRRVLVGLPLAALLLRLTRTAVLGVLGEDYIRTAGAKGSTSAARCAAMSCGRPARP